MATWIDKPSFTSVRSDGAKVGAFLIDGVTEWWGYSPSGHPTGPHASCEEAKRAVDSALPFYDHEANGERPLLGLAV